MGRKRTVLFAKDTDPRLGKLVTQALSIEGIDSPKRETCLYLESPLGGNH